MTNTESAQSTAASPPGPAHPGKVPETFWPLLWLVLRNTLKTTLKQLPLSILIGLLTLAFHTYLIIFHNEGASPDSTKWVGKFLSLTTDHKSGTVIWMVASGLLVGTVINLFRVGPVKAVADLVKTPHTVASFFKQAGPLAFSALAAGVGLAMVISPSVNSYAHLALAAGLGAFAVTQGGRVLSLLLRSAWNSTIALTRTKRFAPFGEAAGHVALVGGSMAFLLQSSNLASGVLIGVFLLGIAFYLAQTDRIKSGGAALSLFLITVLWLLFKNAARLYADDGGWSESDRTLSGWMKSEGAVSTVLTGIPPALGAVVGSALGQTLSSLGGAIGSGSDTEDSPAGGADAAKQEEIKAKNWEWNNLKDRLSEKQKMLDDLLREARERGAQNDPSVQSRIAGLREDIADYTRYVQEKETELRQLGAAASRRDQPSFDPDIEAAANENRRRRIDGEFSDFEHRQDREKAQKLNESIDRLTEEADPERREFLERLRERLAKGSTGDLEKDNEILRRLRDAISKQTVEAQQLDAEGNAIKAQNDLETAELTLDAARTTLVVLAPGASTGIETAFGAHDSYQQGGFKELSEMGMQQAGRHLMGRTLIGKGLQIAEGVYNTGKNIYDATMNENMDAAGRGKAIFGAIRDASGLVDDVGDARRMARERTDQAGGVFVGSDVGHAPEIEPAHRGPRPATDGSLETAPAARRDNSPAHGDGDGAGPANRAVPDAVPSRPQSRTGADDQAPQQESRRPDKADAGPAIVKSPAAESEAPRTPSEQTIDTPRPKESIPAESGAEAITKTPHDVSSSTDPGTAQAPKPDHRIPVTKAADTALDPHTQKLLDEIKAEDDPATRAREEAFWKGRDGGRQKVESLQRAHSELDAAQAGGDAARIEAAQRAVRQTTMDVQGDKHAMHALNELRRDDAGNNPTIQKVNQELGSVYEQADQNTAQRIAKVYGVDPENVQIVKVTNQAGDPNAPVQTSAPERPHYGLAKAPKGETVAGPDEVHGRVDPAGLDATGKKASYDRDLTVRVKGADGVWRDVPAHVTRDHYNQEFYRAAHHGELPPRPAGPDNSPEVQQWRRQIDQYARHMDQASTDRMDAEAYGAGQPDLDAATKDSSRQQDLIDPGAVGQTVEYKAREWFNHADDLEKAGDLSAAEGHREEGMRQVVKQFDNMALKRTQAMINADNAPGAQIPQKLQQEINIMRRVVEPQADPAQQLTPAMAEKLLAKIGSSPTQAAQHLGGYVEALQKLRPPKA